jgi:hypothetical protein
MGPVSRLGLTTLRRATPSRRMSGFPRPPVVPSRVISYGHMQPTLANLAECRSSVNHGPGRSRSG